ncbi:hypothetical protein BDZ97DRAFT_1928683 [Flammula alnicola]|nr:hypothetical protein BDZ97DRAFT_1928683 [Flammula alnicola]
MLDGNDVTCADVHDSHRCDVCDINSDVVSAIRELVRGGQISQSSKSDGGHKFSDSSITTPSSTLNSSEYAFYRTSVTQYFPPSSVVNYTPPIIQSGGLPPPSADRSVNVLVDSTRFLAAKGKKLGKLKSLNEQTSLLQGSCVICWCFQKRLSAPHPDRLWRTCQNRNYIPNVSSWITFKKTIHFTEENKYCFYCHLPIEHEFCPTAHRRGTGGSACNFADFVVLIAWFVRETPPWWHKAVAAFKLKENMDVAEYAIWYTQEEEDSFCNGVELAIWLLNNILHNFDQ